MNPLRDRGQALRQGARRALFLAAALMLGCGFESGARHNLILISIDTLRADHLSAYGYGRQTSPRLDDFAARGVVFENVVSESSWTLPSHVTMFTGMHPTTHGVNLPELRLSAGHPLLTEVLQEHGSDTAAFTSGGYLTQHFGFDRGFDIFDETRETFRDRLSRGLEFLEGRAPADRFFLFLHTYDVHCPYAPSEPFARRFATQGAEPIGTAGRCGNPFYNSRDLSDGEAVYLMDRYDDGILEADNDLGWFLSRLDAELISETLIVITSDHGDEFLEHGRVGHERTLYREVLRIPWIVVGPGIPARRVSASTGLVDLAPTLLDLLDLSLPGPVDGTSRRPEIEGEIRPDLPRVSINDWKTPLRSVMTANWHLVVDLGEDRHELYAVVRDPGETKDRSLEAPDVADRLRRVLADHEASRQAVPVERSDEPTEAQRGQLRALGYLSE